MREQAGAWIYSDGKGERYSLSEMLMLVAGVIALALLSAFIASKARASKLQREHNNKIRESWRSSSHS